MGAVGPVGAADISGRQEWGVGERKGMWVSRPARRRGGALSFIGTVDVRSRDGHSGRGGQSDPPRAGSHMICSGNMCPFHTGSAKGVPVSAWSRGLGVG